LNKTIIRNIILSLSLLLLLCLKASAQQEGDRILAIIGNDVILESDLQYQMQLYARQNQLQSISPAIVQQIFQQMVTEKIILAKAEQDSIEVKDDEINRELEYRIKSLVEQVGSEQRVQEIYGMPLVKIKMTLKDDLIKKMKSDKLRRKKFSSPTKVTDKEVRDFFREYGDSLPPASKEYEMYSIFINRKLTEAEKQLAKEKALTILDSIKNGADFSGLAKRNSDDAGSAVNGGDLGFAKKGVFVKEFEETLFGLNIGEVSDVVETEFGYHIIKLNEKKGDQYRGQHILVSFKKLESSDFETIAFLNTLRDSINNSLLSFEDAAKKYSQEQQTAARGGYMGFVPEEKLDSNYIESLSKLEFNEISKPIKSGDDKDYGYEIVKVKSITEPHSLTLENDFDRIKRYAIILKENKLYEDWVEELKKSIYVDVKF